jgi:hypothetical protein
MNGDRGAPFDPERVLSGESGIVEGSRRRTRGWLRDLADDAAAWLTQESLRVARAANRLPRRSVLVLGIYAQDGVDSMIRAVPELFSTRHDVQFALGALGEADRILSHYTTLDGLEGAGKFENLNRLLAATPAKVDWTVVVDDDVELPRGFLGRFLACAEGLGLQLAQPAHRHTSHAAWPVTRRARWTLARRTRLVEIGPVTAFHSSVAAELLPFPALRMGWGLDAHWGGLALERGWRVGVVDATPIRHRARRPAARYERADAIAEIAGFLPGKPYIDRETAGQVVERHQAISRTRR